MNLDVLDTIDPVQLGLELTEARKRRKITQQAAADTIGVARTTMVAIEQGKRRIRSDELIALAEAYKCQVSDLVRQRPKANPSKPQFRSESSLNEQDLMAIEPHVSTLVEYARRYYELEQILHKPLLYKYPPEYSRSGDIALAAESAAIAERHRLGIGDGPVGNFRSLLEYEIGMRVFYLPLPNKFSAIYVYDDTVGACMAVNQQHPEERQRLSSGHETGHFLGDRYEPDIYIEDYSRYMSPNEQFADYYTLNFFMPTSSIRRKCNEIISSREKLTPADLVSLAAYYGVSVEAMARRLEELKILRVGTWQGLKERGFKVREVQQRLGIVRHSENTDMFPVRYQLLAVEALEQALITENQFAQFLQLDILRARDLAQLLQPQLKHLESGSVDDFDVAESSEDWEGNFDH